MDKSKNGTVLCGLYSSYVSSTKATHHTGPGRGTVVTSYGVRTNTRATKNAGFPKSPKGATLVQFQPCPSVNATVPMFVNDQYNASKATKLYISQHGAGADFQDYFSYLYPLVGYSSILVAPGFYKVDNKEAPASWYQPDVTMAWAAGTGSWTAGEDAVAPRSGDNLLNVTGLCSSYDTFDGLLDYFSDTAKFPNLKYVTFVAHSGGANMVSRYSQFYNGNHPFTFRYILANAANQAYFTDARPDTEVCAKGKNYPYQMVETGMNRYVASRYVSSLLTYQLWLTRDIITLIGNIDTAKLFPFGTQNCESRAQGGRNRRDRNYAWWAYTNILAGTSTNVSAYYGYDQLIASGAIRMNVLSEFNHQNCIVADVGHDAAEMFQSECGRAAIARKTLPSGAEP
ncbi:hypothetical protein CBS101457_001798 [Exobasidium rhododendri]|nr:hypothetical protein CBS101457_001798 [Exobasidium rhododendri]